MALLASFYDAVSAKDYLLVAVLLIAPGPGRWSLDALLFGKRDVRE